MTFWFGLTIVIVLATVIAAIALPGATTKTVYNRSEGRDENVKVPGVRHFALIGVVLAFLTLVISLITIVPTREIGVVTSFGRPLHSLPNGLHLKAPWQKVHTLDGTIQTDTNERRTKKEAEEKGPSRCTHVRIGNESTACVDNTIRWRIRLDAGIGLYRDYRDMENIRGSLVTRELKAALNEVLGDYNPLDQIKEDAKGSADLNEFSRQVTAELRKLVGNDVEIKSVILPIIHFDRNTQLKLNSYGGEVAQTRIAEQKIKTNVAQAKANEALKKSVSNDPNVLVAQCLDIWGDMVKKGQKTPIGFSCFPGGAASTVVVPKS